MVYTVTFNPALDYIVHMDSFLPGEVNRTTREEIYYGGKGINVSTILTNLGVENKALGFIAGFTGEAIERGVSALGIQTDFIRLPAGFSRINVKIKSGIETEINGQGPEIGQKDVEALFGKLDHLEKGDILVLAGSIPKTLPEDIYEKILGRLQDREILFVVDATKDLLLNVLKYRPFLIKPNNKELGEMFGKVLESDEEIILYANRLKDLGARNVLVSMAGDGAVLVTEQGGCHKMGVPSGRVKNSVGAGDSMVAGFLAGYMESGSFETALKTGTAAGSATALSQGLATKEEIINVYKTL